MKKYRTIILTVSLFISSIILYSCSSNQVLRDCDCEDFILVDTVKITLVDTAQSVYQGKYFVQIGCFANRSYAEKFAENAKSNLSSTILVIQSKDNLYRIIAGEYTEIDKAREHLSYVKLKGYSDAFIRDQYGPIE